MTRNFHFLLGIMSVLFTGCIPEPLPVSNIPTLEPKIVISSQFIPDVGFVIFVSKSIGALDAGEESDSEELISQITIDDAIVTISNANEVDTLQNLGTGLYGGLKTDWQSNTNYQLTVISPELGSVRATTQVPAFVPFEQVGARILDNGYDSLAEITYQLLDPAGVNFYMINVQRFSTQQDVGSLLNPRIFTKLLEDTDFEGELHSEIFNVLFQEFSKGDSIAVSMANISPAYYQFLKLRSESRFSFVEFAGEPINYPSNVEGGYGFFNLHTPDVRLFSLE